MRQRTGILHSAEVGYNASAGFSGSGLYIGGNSTIDTANR